MTFTNSQCGGACSAEGPLIKNHLGAAAARGLGQRVTHLAAGAVADEAHRIERLARAARGNQHHFAAQIVAPADRPQHRFGNRLRLGHAPCADHAAGQVARSRFDDAHAALAQNLKVGLRGRMVPHVHVHGGRHQDRRSAWPSTSWSENRRRCRGQTWPGCWPWREPPPARRTIALRRCGRCRSASAAPSPASHSPHRLVMTLWPVSAANVSGCTNFCADSVITTCTSTACRCRARTSSAAL